MPHHASRKMNKHPFGCWADILSDTVRLPLGRALSTSRTRLPQGGPELRPGRRSLTPPQVAHNAATRAEGRPSDTFGLFVFLSAGVALQLLHLQLSCQPAYGVVSDVANACCGVWCVRAVLSHPSVTGIGGADEHEFSLLSAPTATYRRQSPRHYPSLGLRRSRMKFAGTTATRMSIDTRQ